MPNELLDQLLELINFESAEPGRRRWDPVFEILGVQLPQDYMALVETLGGGCFDSYFWLLEPDCPNVHYDLLRTHVDRIEAFRRLWSNGGERPPHQLQQGNTRLIPWATTDNGDFIFWLAEPTVTSSQWTIMVNESRAPEWEHFNVGCLEFLVGMISGRIESEILWSGYWNEPHTFQSSASFV